MPTTENQEIQANKSSLSRRGLFQLAGRIAGGAAALGAITQVDRLGALFGLSHSPDTKPAYAAAVGPDIVGHPGWFQFNDNTLIQGLNMRLSSGDDSHAKIKITDASGERAVRLEVPEDIANNPNLRLSIAGIVGLDDPSLGKVVYLLLGNVDDFKRELVLDGAYKYVLNTGTHKRIRGIGQPQQPYNTQFQEVIPENGYYTSLNPNKLMAKYADGRVQAASLDSNGDFTGNFEDFTQPEEPTSTPTATQPPATHTPTAQPTIDTPTPEVVPPTASPTEGVVPPSPSPTEVPVDPTASPTPPPTPPPSPTEVPPDPTATITPIPRECTKPAGINKLKGRQQKGTYYLEVNGNIKNDPWCPTPKATLERSQIIKIDNKAVASNVVSRPVQVNSDGSIQIIDELFAGTWSYKLVVTSGLKGPDGQLITKQKSLTSKIKRVPPTPTPKPTYTPFPTTTPIPGTKPRR